MNITVDTIKDQIPVYLTALEKERLMDELTAISNGSGCNVSYVLSAVNDNFADEILQGDGWDKFKVYLFESEKIVDVSGIVISNSCDVDSSNKRDIATRITFAPLVKLSKYREALIRSGINNEAIVSKIQSIQGQRTTNIFYLPACSHLSEEYIVRFDDIHSLQLSMFQKRPDKLKKFTLSNTGFYMFLLKLSMHFCRFQENVHRS